MIPTKPPLDLNAARAAALRPASSDWPSAHREAAEQAIADLVDEVIRLRAEVGSARTVAGNLGLGHLPVEEALLALNSTGLRALERAERAEEQVRALPAGGAPPPEAGSGYDPALDRDVRDRCVLLGLIVASAQELEQHRWQVARDVESAAVALVDLVARRGGLLRGKR